MARKRRVERESEETPPPFDERAFLKREISDARLTVVTFVIALVFVGISLGTYHAGAPGIAVLVGFIGTFSLPFLYKPLGIDIEKLFPPKEGKLDEDERKAERRGARMRYASQMFTFFFAWLALFVLALNAPFADVAGPALMRLEAVDPTGKIVGVWTGSALQISLNGNASIQTTIIAVFADPAGVNPNSVKLFRETAGTEVPMTAGQGASTNREFQAPYSALSGSEKAYLTATDEKGNAARTPTFSIDVK